jgi:hypothetical protein
MDWLDYLKFTIANGGGLGFGIVMLARLMKVRAYRSVTRLMMGGFVCFFANVLLRLSLVSFDSKHTSAVFVVGHSIGLSVMYEEADTVTAKVLTVLMGFAVSAAVFRFVDA